MSETPPAPRTYLAHRPRRRARPPSLIALAAFLLSLLALARATLP